MHNEFVYTGMINWMTFARLTAENPAKIFGLKNKGQILPGYDADLLIYQEQEKYYLTKDLKDDSKSDINIYAEKRQHALLTHVIKNGEVVFDKKQKMIINPKGSFLKR